MNATLSSVRPESSRDDALWTDDSLEAQAKTGLETTWTVWLLKQTLEEFRAYRRGSRPRTAVVLTAIGGMTLGTLTG